MKEGPGATEQTLTVSLQPCKVLLPWELSLAFSNKTFIWADFILAAVQRIPDLQMENLDLFLNG